MLTVAVQLLSELVEQLQGQGTSCGGTEPEMNPLGQDDLREILVELSNVSSKWQNIGVLLGVAKHQLENIEIKWSDPKDQLREMIDVRLKKTSPLTWTDIAAALRSKPIEDERLAAQIEKKHGISSNQPETQHSEVSLPSSSPVVELGIAGTEVQGNPAKRDASELDINSMGASKPKKRKNSHIIGPHRFLEQPLGKLLCINCKNIAEEPQQTKCCGKLCCESCQKTLSSTCPGCSRSPLETVPDTMNKIEIGSLQVECTNTEEGCEWTGKFSGLNTHRSECPKEEISCPYSDTGCTTKLLREELDHHLHEKQQHHIEQTVGSIKTLNDTISCQQDQIDKLTTRVEAAEESSQSRIPPLVFRMTDFKQNSATNYWKSPSFYTSELGYRMRLNVKAGFCMDGNNVSDDGSIRCSIELMEGKNDPYLETTCHGEVDIQLLHTGGNSKHLPSTLDFRLWKDDRHTTYTSFSFSRKKRVSDYVGGGHCLYIRVGEIRLNEHIHKPWLLTPNQL